MILVNKNQLLFTCLVVGVVVVVVAVAAAGWPAGVLEEFLEGQRLLAGSRMSEKRSLERRGGGDIILVPVCANAPTSIAHQMRMPLEF